MNKAIDLSIYNQSLAKSCDKNFYLFYVLTGEITLRFTQESVELKEQDLLVLNPNEEVTVECKNGVFVRMCMFSNELLRMLDYKKVVFVCDSRKGDARLYDKLRSRLNELIERGMEMDYYYIHYQKELYEFLSFLITNFANNH